MSKKSAKPSSVGAGNLGAIEAALTELRRRVSVLEVSAQHADQGVLQRLTAIETAIGTLKATDKTHFDLLRAHAVSVAQIVRGDVVVKRAREATHLQCRPGHFITWAFTNQATNQEHFVFRDPNGKPYPLDAILYPWWPRGQQAPMKERDEVAGRPIAARPQFKSRRSKGHPKPSRRSKAQK